MGLFIILFLTNQIFLYPTFILAYTEYISPERCFGEVCIEHHISVFQPGYKMFGFKKASEKYITFSNGAPIQYHESGTIKFNVTNTEVKASHFPLKMFSVQILQSLPPILFCRKREKVYFSNLCIA